MALTSLRMCRKNATELQKSFINDKIEAVTLIEDMTTEKMLKKIRRLERLSQLASTSSQTLSNPPGTEAKSPKWNSRWIATRSPTLRSKTSNVRQ